MMDIYRIDYLYSLGYTDEEIDELEKEDDWRTGDAPWDAPGMSMSDFI